MNILGTKIFHWSTLFTGILWILFNQTLQAQSNHPKVALDSAGNVVAVWIGTNDDYNPIVQSATYTSSLGTWSTAVNLSGTSTATGYPQIAMDSSGNAVGVWIDYDNTYGTDIVKAAFLPAGGAWSSAVGISSTSEDAQNDFQLKVNSDGSSIVSWTSYQSSIGNYVINVATSAFNGTWSSPTTISP